MAANSTPHKPTHDDQAQSSAQDGGAATDETTITTANDHHTQSSAQHGTMAANGPTITAANNARGIPGRRPRTYPGTLATWRVDEQH